MSRDGEPSTRKLVGRGAQTNPDNRFVSTSIRPDGEHLEFSDDSDQGPSNKTCYFDDLSDSIVSENSSPDLPFSFSLNPYRGCAHGCSYCYARPTHEYLGLSAGLDFETTIFVKRKAAQLLRKKLSNPKWEPSSIMLSGVTDCYQPCERKFEVTKQCLEVLAEFRHPVSIITKNALILRDLEMLRELAQDRLVEVAISVTTLDQSLTKVLEPRSSAPAARLRAIAELSAAKVPVHLMVAPILPGLTDHEVPEILREGREAGAVTASYTVLRLPFAVAEIFEGWLQQNFPDAKEKVLNRVRDLRGGELNDSNFGSRMKGEGARAEHISATFKLFAKKFGFQEKTTPLNTSLFRPTTDHRGNRLLF